MSRLTIESSQLDPQRFSKTRVLVWNSSSLLTLYNMQECSSGVGAPSPGEMKGRHCTLAKRRLPYLEGRVGINNSPKKC